MKIKWKKWSARFLSAVLVIQAGSPVAAQEVLMIDESLFEDMGADETELSRPKSEGDLAQAESGFDLIIEEALEVENPGEVPAGLSLDVEDASDFSPLYAVILPESVPVDFFRDQEAVTAEQAEYPAGELVELTLVSADPFHISEVSVTGEESQNRWDCAFDGSSLSFVMPEENVVLEITEASLPSETAVPGLVLEDDSSEISAEAQSELGDADITVTETEAAESQSDLADADITVAVTEPAEAQSDLDNANITVAETEAAESQSDLADADITVTETEAAEAETLPDAGTADSAGIGEPETLPEQEQDFLEPEEESEDLTAPSDLEEPLEETDEIYGEETVDPGLSLATDAQSGTCGASAAWSLADGVLTISGTGAIDDYSSTSPGWYSQANSITAIVIQSGITAIGAQAFCQLPNLTSVTIPSTVTSMGSDAFYGDSSLETVSLPQSITTLSYGAFADCYSLTTFSAPGLQSIEDYVFQGTQISDFTIGKNVTEISSLAFFDTAIQAYYVESGNTKYTASNGILFTDQGKTLLSYPARKTDSSYQVPDSVTKINAGAFIRNAYLTQISIGKNVTSLGDSAFQQCTALTSVTIPDSVTEAGYFTFYGCSSLQSVQFGAGLLETSYQMFENCVRLTSINFGSKLQKLYARTFAGCSSLTTVSLPANITEIGNGCFGDCYALTSFTSSNLSEIPYQAFLNDSKLTEVNLNEGVINIYRCAFLGCSALASVTLPASVTYVHSYAFETTTKITSKNQNMAAFGQNGYRYLDTVSVSGTRNYSYAYDVLTLVNQERAADGKSALVMNESLLETAMQRAAEIVVLFSHTRPDGSSCFDLNKLMRGENIAYGQATPQAAMESWMNSQGHKENILNSGYTTIGIGCFSYEGRYYWVQCFGSGADTSSCAMPANNNVSAAVNIAAETFREADTSYGIIWGTPESYTYSLEIALSKSTITKGDSATLTCYLVNPGSQSRIPLSGSDFTCTSSDPSVAQVTGATIQGLKAGSAQITVQTSKGYYKATATVTVEDPSSAAQTPSGTTQNPSGTTQNPSGTTQNPSGTTQNPSGTTQNPSGTTQNPSGTTQNPSGTTLAKNTIKSSNITKNASTKSQSVQIKATVNGGAKLTYKSNHKSVTVSSTGKVTIAKNFTGTAKITITAKATAKYAAATKTITVTVNKISNKITASNLVKTTSAKKQSFASGIKCLGSAKLTYKSDNKSVTVSSAGKITVAKNFTGKATITVKAAAKGIYKATSKKITVTVNPAKTSLSSLTNKKGKKALVKWKRNKNATGYELQYSTSSKFKSSKKITISKNKTTSRTISGLKKGSTYYVRIRAYKTVSGKKYYSGWSGAKKVKITK